MNDPCNIWFRIFVVVFILISSGTLLWLFFSLIFDVFLKGGNFWNHYQENKIQELEEKLQKCNENEND
jgi:hypothetical protein